MIELFLEDWSATSGEILAVGIYSLVPLPTSWSQFQMLIVIYFHVDILIQVTVQEALRKLQLLMMKLKRRMRCRKVIMMMMMMMMMLVTDL